MDEEIGFTVEENELLNNMAVGQYDGFVGNPIATGKGVIFWFVIQDGTPACYFELPTQKKLENGKIERTLGTMMRVKAWLTDEEKLAFIREYGEQFEDESMKAYTIREKVTKLEEKWIADRNPDSCIFLSIPLAPVQ